MGSKLNLTGQKFGKLTTINLVDRNGYPYWLCRCDCGKEIIVNQADLRRLHTQSCGCLRVQRNIERNTRRHTHGMSNTKEYMVYQAMKIRCSDPEDPFYSRYGGRGIKVCDRWAGKNGFINFITDMGQRPSGMWIERKDNDGDYEPSNCIWADPKTQANNRSNSKKRE